jgi:hypothetical protein
MNFGWQTCVGSFTITQPNTCLADTNDDGEVDVTDLLAAIAQWGEDGSAAGAAEPFDIVDVADILVMVSDFGSCP